MIRILSHVVILVTGLALFAPAQAQQTPEEIDAASRDYFSDTYLLNQDGEDVRF